MGPGEIWLERYQIWRDGREDDTQPWTDNSGGAAAASRDVLQRLRAARQDTLDHIALSRRLLAASHAIDEHHLALLDRARVRVESTRELLQQARLD